MSQKLYSRRFYPFFMLLVSACFTLLTFSAVAQDRGLSLIAKAVAGADDFDVGKQYAVIIGIDKYEEWPSLRSAAAEARDVRRLFDERYFIDEFLELYDRDATASGIRRLFLDVLPKKVGLKDSLLIFYAGHGYLDESRTGFWIASDGTKDVYSQRGWIPNAQLRNYIAGLKVQRVLLIADACFSGDFLNVTRGAGPTVDSAYFRKALKLTARQVLTSGASETVPDESEFGRQLISLLERNTDSVLDPHTMFDRIRRGVTKTEPLIGTIPGNETGATFALFLKPTTGILSVVTATEADIYIDGKKAGRTVSGKSLTIPDLPAGERKLEIRYASSTEDRRVVVEPGVATELSFSFKPVTTGTLLLTGFPEGATLHLNGGKAGDLGHTGLTVEGLAAGRLKARVSYGLWPDAVEYEPIIEPGKTTALKFTGGSIIVGGLPRGVSVYLKEAFLASASKTDENLAIGPFPAGSYALRFEGAGWEPATVSVFVSAGKDVVCVPQLKPVKVVSAPLQTPATAQAAQGGSTATGAKPPSGRGILSLTSNPPGLSVRVDEGDYIITPETIELAPGSHSITVMSSFVEDRYYLDQPTEWVTVPDGGEIAIPVKARQGSSELNFELVPPGFTVFSGEDKLGVTPIGLLTIPAGTARLRFERTGETPRTYTSVIYPNSVERVPWGSRPELAAILERRTIDIKRPESWNGISPILAPTLPMRASAGILNQAGMGITKVYICRDDKYLYWRIDFEKTNPLRKPPKGTKTAILTQLSIEAGMSTQLNLRILNKIEKGEMITFMGIWSGEWKQMVMDVISYERDDTLLVQRIAYDKVTKYVPEGVRAFNIDLAHETGSGWESGFVSGPAFYIDFRK